MPYHSRCSFDLSTSRKPVARGYVEAIHSFVPLLEWTDKYMPRYTTDMLHPTFLELHTYTFDLRKLLYLTSNATPTRTLRIDIQVDDEASESKATR